MVYMGLISHPHTHQGQSIGSTCTVCGDGAILSLWFRVWPSLQLSVIWGGRCCNGKYFIHLRTLFSSCIPSSGVGTKFILGGGGGGGGGQYIHWT